MPDKFIYAIEERIGNPDLFTGRKRELANHLDWVQKIEEKRSKSIAILARRSSDHRYRGIPDDIFDLIFRPLTFKFCAKMARYCSAKRHGGPRNGTGAVPYNKI